MKREELSNIYERKEINNQKHKFRIFNLRNAKKEKGVEVRFEDRDLWLTQKAFGELYDTSK